MGEKYFKHGVGGRKPHRYPPEIREQSVAMVQSTRADFATLGQCLRHVCELFGIGSPETLRTWVKQAEIDAGNRGGLTSDNLDELRRLKRENAELKRTNGILKAASAFFAAEFDRPLKR